MSAIQLTQRARSAADVALARVTDEIVAAYQRDGAVWISGLLAPAWLRLIGQGVQRNINALGPLSRRYLTEGGEFYDDICNYAAIPEYQRLVADSPIVEVMARVMRSRELWLFCDQIFVKEGGYSHRTRWHQDVGYWTADGDKLAGMWIALDPLTEDETLEVVAGSFRGPIYHMGRTSTGGPLPPSDAPPIPDIEAEREKWPIIRHASQPGDVLIFHPAAVHGGGEMRPGGRRRSLTLRFFGDGTRLAVRDFPFDPEFPGVTESLNPGDPLRHPWFPQVFPRGQG
jgi:ectoine hydroxylase-related dioxygenase (phytanoyl-CoA dioxygenase family)